MTFLRHAPRHVHHSVANHIESGLTQLGWLDPALTPFGAPAVTVKTDRLTSTSLSRAEAGLVTVSLGDEAPPELEEMGGVLSSQEYPLFVDVFQDNHASALALATDVKDILRGRFDFMAVRGIPVIDQITGTPVPDWRIDFEDIERVEPDSTLPLFWQTVKVTAVTHFNEAI